MSCRKKRVDVKEKFDDIDAFDENCVCDVVKAIADAQNDVFENQCDVSCEKSIQSLVSPILANDLDTVPFILYCEGTCKPFKAFGADIQGMGLNQKFDCVESFIFRVKEVDEDCCAVLELLTFDDAEPDAPGNQQGALCDNTPCEQLDGQLVNDLMRTGICITVDLDCFCAITCLPAVDLI